MSRSDPYTLDWRGFLTIPIVLWIGAPGYALEQIGKGMLWIADKAIDWSEGPERPNPKEPQQ